MLIPFGNIDDMALIKAPSVGVTMNPGRWTTRSTFLNGAGFIRSSGGSHATRDVQWGNLSMREYAIIMKYVERNEPIVWFDPFIADTNVLSQAFSNPATGGHSPIRNGYGVPTGNEIRFTVHAGSIRRSQYISVPEGYQLHFRPSGSGTPRFGIRVAGSGAPFGALTWGAVTVRNAGLYEIQVTGNGDVTFGKSMAQVVQVGMTPDFSTYLPGLGATQYRIDHSTVSATGQSSAIDTMSIGFSMLEAD